MWNDEEEEQRKARLFKIRHPSIKNLFERIKPESRKEEFKIIIQKKLRVLLGPLSMTLRTEEPTMADAFSYLGQATARLALLEEIHKFIQQTMNVSIPMWPEELWNLRELSTKQQATCTQLVKAILFKADKEQQEANKLPIIKDIAWQEKCISS
ncbi:MAG: hypothetical protein NT096_00195 [Proteobacteria bacterium]|nr:hypothetical protein [Pseudomonadota bacterium]